MSFVIATPEMVASAASDLASIGSMIGEANAAAMAPTTGVVAAAGDEVSAAIASVFCSHAREYQALIGQSVLFHEQFVQALSAGAGSYVSTEIANARAAAAFVVDPVGIVQSVGSAILPELVGSIPGVQDAELALDAAGPVVVALPVLEHQTGFVNALQTGNLGAATAALSSPAVEQAVLYGQDTVSVQVPLSAAGIPLQSAGVSIPFGGLLAPVQPITLTLTVAGPGGPSSFTVPIPGTEVGGILPAVEASGPSLLLGAL